MEEKRQWIVRILLGGAVGVAVLLPLGWLFNGLVNGGLLSTGRFPGRWISPDLYGRLGSAPLALAVQLTLYFALGGAVGAATLPFADGGRALALRSLLHFAVTAGIFALLLQACGWAWDGQALLLFLALLAAAYVLVWIGRWIGWYAEVAELRVRLGLAAGPSPLKWRETLPYLPFALLLCLILPLLLRWVDSTYVIDVPVFSQLLYPFLVLPVAGLCSGVSLGRRQGFCPLYPAACLLPLMLSFSHSLPFLCAVAAGTTLVGNAAGAVWKKMRNEASEIRN